MKKLMVAVAIVCAAVLSQAAALDWQTYGWAGDSDPGMGDWITGGQAYLVLVTDTATFAVADDLSVTGGSIVDSAAFADGTANGTWTTESLVGGQAYKFAAILTTEGSSITVPTTGLYGVDTNEGNFFDVVWDASTGGTFYPEHDGTYINTAVAGSSPIPEPTSGLLMLLGMAGLALRRRRA